ncbi:uncharacterized protein B0T23DRAFT_314669 [Neurospora hispaniola]|uniref:Uncharacterized protein n=1 Tax=Neurospora hispaniola TaxID=588809 RepID=A0AAJ0IBY2_9PEZI|nr:hypothetical protein B0T23DRAFT_314669 [Neurospora hispaniola]
MQPMVLVSKGLSPRKFQTQVLVEFLTPTVSAFNSLHIRPHLMPFVVLDLDTSIATSRNTSGPANTTMLAGLNRHERVAIATRSLSAGQADQNFHLCCQPGPIAQMLEARSTARPCLLGAGVAASAATLLLVVGVKHSCRFPDHVLNFVCLSVRSYGQESDHRWMQKVRVGNRLLVRGHMVLRINLLMGRSRLLMKRSHLVVKRRRMLIRGKKARILLMGRSRLLMKRRRMLVWSSVMRSHLLRLGLVIQKHLVKCSLVLRDQRATAEITLIGLGLLWKVSNALHVWRYLTLGRWSVERVVQTRRGNTTAGDGPLRRQESTTAMR